MKNRGLSLEQAALFTVMITSFMSTFMVSSVNLALPAMGREFGSSAVLTSWIVNSYLLATAAFMLPFGRLADILGRRKIYLVGTVSYILISLLIAISPSIQVLILFRIFQGMSAAMIFSTGMAILTSVYPPQRRGRALGYSVSVTYLGLSLGPVLGGFMNHQFGWESIFYFIALLGICAAALTRVYLKAEWAEAGDECFDSAGAILYIAGLLAVLYGLSSIASSVTARILVFAGLFILLGFVRWEMKTSRPILQVSLFIENTAFTMSNLAAMINYSATFAVTLLLSVYLQVVRGYSSQAAGFVLLAQPLVMAVLSPFAGILSDRIEPRTVASIGMGCSALSLFFFIFLQANTSPVWLVANLLLAGLGFSLFGSPNNNAIMGSVLPKYYGIASSTLGTMRMIGQAVSMSIVTLLVAFYIGRVSLTAANPVSYMLCMRAAFIVFTMLCLAGIIASLARGRIRNPNLSTRGTN